MTTNRAPPKTLYFDESNFTGYNLLDADQPIFVTASTDIGDDEAEGILRASFPEFRGGEFKFSKAWKDKHKRSLLPFAKEMGVVNKRIYCYTIDKRYSVLTKAMDFLVEPIVTNAGFDWYKNGYCRRYVNWAHFGLTAFASPELYEAIVTAYQQFSRFPSEQTLNAMRFRFRVMANSLDEEFNMVLDQLATGAEMFHKFHDLSTFKGTDEMQVTTMIALVASWRQRYDDDFVVMHDKSANFFRRRELWEKIVGPDAPAKLHPLGDGTNVQFPLRVIRTEAVDSKLSYAIQLCDMIAGMTAKVCNPNNSPEDKEWLAKILEAGFGKITYNGIYFRPEFPDGPPTPLDGPDVVDMMVDNIIR